MVRKLILKKLVNGYFVDKVNYIVFLGLFLFLFSCKSDGGNETKNSMPTEGEIDTRKLVEKVHNEIGAINITYTLNLERAEIYKQKVEESSGVDKFNWQIKYGLELINGGETEKGLNELLEVEEFCKQNNITDRNTLILLKSVIAISYMRMGELQNCIQHHNHQSCIVPISQDGIHELKNGSENAIEKYMEILAMDSEHYQSIWLLNLAHMTLGTYPNEVPKEFLLDPEYFTKNENLIPTFDNIASSIGIDDGRLSGSPIIEDFDQDGDYDIFTTSWGINDRVYFYENKDGHFEENAESRGLEGHVGGLCVKQTDYNNDGWIDIYIMRGAWMQRDGEIPNTLLRNNQDGTFTDVTLEAGLTKHTPTQACSWYDFNKDGWLDLIVANESIIGTEYETQLWINNQDGTFTDYGLESGLVHKGYFKAVSVGDLNNDSWPDIYMSNLSGDNFIFFHQKLDENGIPKFKELGQVLNVTAPEKSFPNMIFDINNDGNSDILVSSYNGDFQDPATEFVLNIKGIEAGGKTIIYMNNGDGTFTNKSDEFGLTEAIYTMGCNYGDINNDGYEDIYLGTGKPSFFSIVPNKMFLNQEGKSFADVSYAGGFGHIQKGHGVSMTDLDRDGHLDVYAVMGGAYQGDVFQNAFFHNPGNENNYVVLKFKGTTSNRMAIGTRIVATITEKGKKRKIYRTIGSGASFGSSSLDCHIGIGKATQIDKLEILWPNQQNTQMAVSNLEANKAYIITEGSTVIEKMPYEKIEFHRGHSGHNH